MKKKFSYYVGLLVFISGIAMLIFSIVEIKKEASGYIISALLLIMGFLIMVVVYTKERDFCHVDDIDNIIKGIDKSNPTAHESVILDLKCNTLDTELEIVDYIVSDLENIYLEISNDRTFHVLICRDFVEIESFDPKDEQQITELEEMIEKDPSSKKRNQKKILQLMKKKSDKVIYKKISISSKTKEDIISLIENNIL